MITEESRAERWHDTDHGKDMGRPRKRPPPGVKWRRTKLPDWVSSCWCCCELCDPDWDPPRPNPFWDRAQAEMARNHLERRR